MGFVCNEADFLDVVFVIDNMIACVNLINCGADVDV